MAVMAKRALPRWRQSEADDRVQTLENWSRIHGRVEAWQPPRKAGEPGMLTLVVARVDDVASSDGSRYPNLMADATGTIIQVTVPARTATTVKPRKGSIAVIDVRRGRSPDRLFAHPDHISLTHE
jgi:hypothetical protein